MKQNDTARGRRNISPLYFLAVLSTSIFITEAVVMVLLSFAPQLPTAIETALDSTMLVFFVSPALYFFVFRPLAKALRDSEEMAEKVVRLSYLPEDAPDPIIEIHLKSQKIIYCNKSTVEQFPELGEYPVTNGGYAVDWNHQLFSGLRPMSEEFMLDGEAKALDVMEAVVSEDGAETYKVYDRKLRYIPQQNILRIYTVDISRQEKLAKATQNLLIEVKQIKNELESEHQEAEEVGKSLLRSQPLDGNRTASVGTEPCSKAGGDRAGFMTRTSPGGREEDWLVVFDASGHGKGAAKFQEVAIGGLLTLIGIGTSMAESLKTVNQTLEKLGTGRFLVGSVFRLMRHDEKPADLGFRWVEEFNMAQHCIFALDPDGGEAKDWGWERDETSEASLPLGLFDGGAANLKPAYRKVKSGSRIIAFTDGITEAVNPLGEPFGRERLKDLSAQTSGLNPYQSHAEIVRAVKCWVGALPENTPDEELGAVLMNDDITIAIVDVV